MGIGINMQWFNPTPGYTMSCDKLRWLQSLQVGDMVCDCRYKHLRITNISVEYWIPEWARKIVEVVNYCSPHWACSLDSWFRESRFAYVGDALVTLEDGCMFSVNDCCDPADHHESIHRI